MDSTAWNLAKQVFHDALEESGPDRMKVVEAACGGDEELLALVKALLDAHEEAGDFLSEQTMGSVLLEAGAVLGEADPASPPALTVDSDPAPLPALIGPYEILGVLGVGGMGTVYHARDPDLHRELAIKVLSAELVDSQQLARFEREAKLLASLNHPNIATIHAIGDADGRPYLVLELIEGESLSQRLSGGPLSVERALEIGRQVAEAVEAAHEAGIVHRDLKPANVMITGRGLVKVLDFGIAKAAGKGPLAPELADVTSDGTLMGTIPYMSPEQVTGEEVDERTDLWALGCLLYEALTGKSPFDRTTLASTLVAIQKEFPNLAALPGGTPQPLRSLVAQCLEKDPGRRPDSATAVRAILSDTLAGLRMTSAAGWSRLTPAGRAAWAAAGVLLTLGVLALVEGRIVRAIIEWLPPAARYLVTDGGRLAAAVLAVVLLAVWVLTGGPLARVRRRVKSAKFGVAGVVALALLVSLVPRATEWVDNLVSGVDVYVCLPFGGMDDEGADDLRSISNRYRDILQEIFYGAESVTIQPRVYDAQKLDSLPPLCTFQRAEDWLEGTRHDPDLVLCNDVNVFTDPNGEGGMTVVSELTKAYEGRLEGIRRIGLQGGMSDVRYLALTTGAEIVKTLQQEERYRLTPEDETAVGDRILKEFGDFLIMKGAEGAETAREVERIRTARLGDEQLGVEQVLKVLETYEPEVNLDRYEERSRRTREALLQRFGGGA